MCRKINDEYFDWLCYKVCGDIHPSTTSFRKLLSHLHMVEFTYLIPKDQNRASDGIDLRRRFALDEFELDELGRHPCSVLEMMVALAIRCEETIMDDTSVGDRTKYWFWSMIRSLGLNSMSDNEYDERYVDEVIDIFLNREYDPDGKGGLFHIKYCEDDLRDVEIWTQLCWYLDTIADI